MFADWLWFPNRLLPRALCSLSRNCTVSRLSSTQSSLLFSEKSRQKCSPALKVLVNPEAQAVPATPPPLIGRDRIGVLLLNLGGPETLDDVQPFLFNLFADPVKLFSLFFFPSLIENFQQTTFSL